MKSLRIGWFALAGISLLLASACTSKVSPKVSPLESANAQLVMTLGEKCQTIFDAHIAAWDSRDPENLRSVYIEEIVHFDGQPLFVGIDDVVDMAAFMFNIFKDWEMEAGDTYISKDKCLGVWINWGVFGFTEDDPGREFDLLETRDDQIFYWTLFYDQKFHSAFSDVPEVVDNDFLQQFADSWSAGDASILAQMYTVDAKLEDSLFEISIEGNEPIKEYAQRFLAKSPGAGWEILYPFAESPASPEYAEEYPFPSQGAIFAIHVQDADGNPCDIQAAIYLTPNEDGVITYQETLYKPDTLLACGWAE